MSVEGAGGGSSRAADVRHPHQRLVLAAVVAGSIALQLALLLPNAKLPPVLDEVRYLRNAQSIASGRGLRTALRPPGYPYALAVALAVAPAGTPPRLAAGLMQIAVCAVTLCLLYLLALESFGPRVALASAAIFGFYPSVAAHTHLLWSDSVALLPGVAALLLSVHAARTGRYDFALAAGVAFGAGALTREYVFWFIPVAMLWLGLASRERRHRPAAAALVAVGAALAILPWTARNASVHGEFILISSNTWQPLYTATLGPTANILNAAEFGALSDLERNRYAREQVLRLLRQQPSWLVHKLRRAIPQLLSLQSFPLRHLQRGWYARHVGGEIVPVSAGVRRAVALACVLAYLGLLVAVVCGVAATRWTAPRLLLLLFACYAAAVILPFPIVTRYRLPIIAALVPFAAAWLTRSQATAGRLRGWRLAAACGSAAILVALTFSVRADEVFSLLSGVEVTPP